MATISTATSADLQSATWRAAALRWMDRWIDPVLLLLAAATIPLVIVETGSPTPQDEVLLATANWTVWALFTTNFAVRMAIALDRRAEFRELRWDLIIIFSQPTLAVVGRTVDSGAGIIRMIVVIMRVVSRGAVIRRAFRKLRAEPLRIVAGFVPFLWLTSAAVLVRTEAGNGSISSIGEALWWGAATLTTVGYGDISPQTGLGRTMAVVTMVGGIGMFSLVTARLAEAMVNQRTTRTRNEVLEEGHTLLLGWSPKIFTMIDELVVANDVRKEGTVVVLSDLSASAMQRQIEARVSTLARSNTKVVCRTGSPSEPSDLHMVRPDRARAVVVVDDDAEEVSVVKEVLALVNDLGEVADVPVIVEIDNPATASALERAFPDRLTIVEPQAFIARAAAQSCRTPGVALAYEELLSFHGNELYLHAQPEAAGLTFGAILNAFSDACVIGVRQADGTCALNPPHSTVIRQDDTLVVVAHDAAAITWVGPAEDAEALAPPDTITSLEPEHVAIFGWNQLGAHLVGELANYVAAGSTVTIVVDPAYADEARSAIPSEVEGLEINVRSAGGKDQSSLVQSIGGDCDHAVILCYRDGHSVAEADARALVTMLQVRQAVEATGREVSVITELLDERDAALVPRTRSGDFIVSERLTSLLLTQLAENQDLVKVWDDLLDADGSELYCKPAVRYMPAGVEASFSQIVDAVARWGEIAIGVRLDRLAGDPDEKFGVLVNPGKDDEFKLTELDQVIVVARDAS